MLLTDRDAGFVEDVMTQVTPADPVLCPLSTQPLVTGGAD
jgi:hypothetical protein